ncbi:MAG: 4-hydroxy-3-methylbut-2-enyl diphosphate reductase [Candidatus Omnitrophota bacterium]|nr:MAG: 4-hydroxy-3-methylbut-2-enyl diphosphate reductase [Candidatus Omnitrophota bacterium]
MKITLAKHTGFCFGVRKAIEKAYQTLKEHKRKKSVFMLGEIVHNEKVINELKKEGLELVSSLKEVPSHSILILKAHGTEKEIYEESQGKDIKLIDATCPMVKEIHRKALYLEKKGHKIVIFGDKNHAEIKALISYLKDFIVIEKKKELKDKELSGKIALLLQSTQSLEESLEILKILKKTNPQTLFINTICPDAQARQKEVIKLSKNNDKVIVVGSKKSANTRRLYKLSKKYNKNTYWLNRAESIKKNNFGKEDRIAIISGASTPKETVEKIIKRLKKLYSE